MLKGLRNFLVGRRVVTIAQGDLCAAFDLIYKCGLSFRGEKRCPDGSIKITMSERDAMLFARRADARDLAYAVSPPHGMPVLLESIKAHPMLALLGVLLIVWLSVSERIVWDVRISGNTKTDADVIIAQLEELGFGVGTYYPSIDFNKLHADYSAAQEDIAWLSIFMDGSVADVQVREKSRDTREKHDAGVYANVVADCAGVVTAVNVFEGQAVVKAGDSVFPGQVLISGVVEMKEENAVRYEYAAGEVFCTVSEPIEITSPITRVEEEYNGREKTERSLKIFKKRINLFVNGGKDMPSCDKIEEENQVLIFNKYRLPVWISTVTYREYAEVSVTRSPEAVADEAMSALAARLKELAAIGTVIEKKLDAKFEDGAYSVSGEIYIERDIGKTSEFTAAP